MTGFLLFTSAVCCSWSESVSDFVGLPNLVTVNSGWPVQVTREFYRNNFLVGCRIVFLEPVYLI